MEKHIETLVQRYPQLESCKDDILKAYQILEEAYSAGRKRLRIYTIVVFSFIRTFAPSF